MQAIPFLMMRSMWADRAACRASRHRVLERYLSAQRTAGVAEVPSGAGRRADAARYSITSSARPSIIDGTLTPSDFAALIDRQLKLGGLLNRAAFAPLASRQALPGST
jgi:hypothetical protein